MATQFSIPKSPSIHTTEQDNFLGADFTSDAANVDATKSPNVVNMIRSVPGKVRKRMGYELLNTMEGCVYGAHHFTISDVWFIHCGKKLYKTDKTFSSMEEAYTDMNENRSVSFQLNQKLIILDGKKLLMYDGTSVTTIESNAYIPTLTIAKDPTGGGTDYEALNLLQPAFIELFYVKQNSESADYDPATIKTFQLTFGKLDDTTVKAWLMNSDGEWIEKTENTDFTVNRTTGLVTFTTAPGSSPVSGEDNVKIQAYRTVEGYADRVNHCTIGAMFGVNGANDRLFISGNTDNGTDDDGKSYTYINYDWYSQQYDPTYWLDTGYSKLGSDSSAIMGYSIINNYLAAHKDANELSQSVILREGDIVDDKPTFKIINTLQGAGAVSRYSFQYLETEPLFFTKLGIYAITAQDVTGEKYAQNRSYYLNGKLFEEENLENAFSVIYKNFYFLCLNNHVYILDGLQTLKSDRSDPYATRQYAGFYFENVPAYTMWVCDSKQLLFGSSDGKIYRFYENKDSNLCYNDNGTAISCAWETADVSGELFYKNKTFRYIALRCTPATATSVCIYAMRKGIWELIKEDSTTIRQFSFSTLIFSKFMFNCDASQKVIATKVRLKKLDKARFKFTNSEYNEPLGLNNMALEYTQNGNYK